MEEHTATEIVKDEESSGKKRAKRALPWLGSIVGHMVLLGLVVLLSWNLAQFEKEKSTPLITAEVSDSTVALLSSLKQDSSMSIAKELTPLSVETNSELESQSFSVPQLSSALPSGLGSSAPSSLGTVSFAGLGGGAARRIVFVVDASGSMVGAFPVVTAELTRSLTNLSSAQSYSVIFFQRDEAVVVPPKGKLTPATNEAVTRTMRWIRESVVPSGRSNPVAALERALKLKPQVVFLLSSNITGSGRYEVDLAALMARLDKLNPANKVDGRRPVVINCIQFLDPDPLDALRSIAATHGAQGGPGNSAYRFLGRSELGLAPGQR